LKSYNRLPSRAFIDEFQSRAENDPTVPALSVRASFPPPELPDTCSLLTRLHIKLPFCIVPLLRFVGSAESPTSDFRPKPLHTQPEHDPWLSLSRGSGLDELDLAIREFAPGEVVIDGLVHRSEGIRPA
jgi:hypothetical protein